MGKNDTCSRDRALRVAAAGKLVGWFSANYKLLAETRCGTDRYLGRARRRQQGRALREGAGRRISIEFWTLEAPAPARSRKYAFVVVDECGHAPDLKTQWEQAIRPTLVDLEGSALFLSTPNGIANYFYSLYLRGPGPEREDWASFQASTWENLHILKSENPIVARGHDGTGVSPGDAQSSFHGKAPCSGESTNAIWRPPAAPRVGTGYWMEQYDQSLLSYFVDADWGRVKDATVFLRNGPPRPRY
jgi:hypothetical protein